MKRIDKIYSYISEGSQEYKVEQLTGHIGFDATEISEKLDIIAVNFINSLHNLFCLPIP